MSTTVEHNDDPVATTSTSTEMDPKKITMPSPLEAARIILSNTEKGRSSIEGNIYHLHLAIMIILRAYRMHQQDNEFDFLVAMEVAAAGKFDDILYSYFSPQLATGALVIQAKHKENMGSKIEKEHLCPPQEDPKSTSIPTYFVSFLEVDQKLTDNTRYVLCTNADLHVKLRESCFNKIEPQEDDSLLFCEAIGATCYQFDADKPFPGLDEKLQNACIAKLGKELAQAIVKAKVITFNDTLFDTFFNLINSCIEQLPTESKTNDSSVTDYDIYKLKENFYEADISTTTGKLRSYFETEHEMLLKKKKKKDHNNATNELKLMIDKKSFTTASDTAEAGDFTKFDQKVREFYDKFLLVCNSGNEEKLKTQAVELLPQWCGADRKAIIDNLEGKLLNEMKSSAQPVPLDLKYMQDFFMNIALKQNISDLRHSSKEYLEEILKNFNHIQLDPVYLEGSNLYSFLKDESGFGVYGLSCTLDLTVSSRILLQTLSMLKYETIFIDSTKYANMNDILDDVLSYLRDVNHPTIKVITILGHHDHLSNNEIKQLSERYCQKIVVVEKISGSTQNDETFGRILVKHLTDEASNRLYRQAERMMYGTKTPLSIIVEETDELSFLFDVLELCDESKKENGYNLNEHNYQKIEQWYICRHYMSYDRKGNMQWSQKSDKPMTSALEDQRALASNNAESEQRGDENSSAGKVCIILNDAGFGKSTYFTWLAWRLSTLDPSLYIIKFISIEYSTDFDRLIGSDVLNLNNTDIMRLLYLYVHLALFVPSINKRWIEETDVVRRKAEHCANLLTLDSKESKIVIGKTNKLSSKELIEMRLFREKFNQRKLVLILDGYDEITPYYKDVVMHCFERFARLYGVNLLYLSSRPYGFEDVLLKTFENCRIHRLLPFTNEDIKLSFHKFLLRHLHGYEHYEEEHRRDILENLYKHIVNVLKDIITVPLLLYMVQIILLDEMRIRVNETLPTIIDDMLKTEKLEKFHLVEQFIKRKIQILSSEKAGTTNAAGATATAKQIVELIEKNMKEQHMLLAMCVIFDSKAREKLLYTEEKKRAGEIMEKVNQGNEKTGIVLGVQNEVPQFLHRTFAEYFTACWLFRNWKRFKNESIFKSETIWSDSLKETREFFDRLILRESEGCDLHLALVNRSKEQIEEILRNKPSAVNVKDMVDRLPLHLIEYSDNFIDLILEKTSPERINETDDLYGWNALDYAFVLERRGLAFKLFSKRVNPSINNLFEQLCSNSIDVLITHGDFYTNILDNVRSVDRKHLAEELSERVAKYLIEDQQVDIFTSLPELKSASILQRVVSLKSLLLFRHLITKSGPEWLDLENRGIRLIRLSNNKESNQITFFLLEQRPSLAAQISCETLYYFAAEPIYLNQMELFKNMFRYYCINQEIECVEEHNFSDVIGNLGKKGTIEIEIPFNEFCCHNKNENNERSIYRLLYEATRNGNTQIASYILQKTNMVISFEYIRKLVLQLAMQHHKGKNHKMFTPLFTYLFKKLSQNIRRDDEAWLQLFRMTISYGCVFMLPSLIAIGFDLKKINLTNHWHCFVHRLSGTVESSAVNMFLYLQQHSCDFFETFGPTGESIFEIAITARCFTAAQALLQDKFRNRSNSEKENVLSDLLHRTLLKRCEEDLMLKFIKYLLEQSAIGGTMENEMWHSVYSSIFKRIPIV